MTQISFLKILEIKDVSELNKSDGFLSLLSECGCNQLLTDDNRDFILQTIIFYEVIGKRTAALDQLREGLKTLNVLEYLCNNAELCKPLFVCQGELKVEDVQSMLEYDDTCSVDFQNNFNRWLLQTDQTALSEFIYFITACYVLPTRKIDVKSDGVGGIHASTCELSLSVPPVLDTFEKLSRELNAVIPRGKSRAFNVV